MSEIITMDGEYVTRDGREVRIWCVDAQCNPDRPVYGEHRLDGRSGWSLNVWSTTGKYSAYGEHGLDLIPKPKRHKRTVWLNVYPECVGPCHMVREYADNACNPSRIACLELNLDFAEGEGLEP